MDNYTKIKADIWASKNVNYVFNIWTKSPVGIRIGMKKKRRKNFLKNIQKMKFKKNWGFKFYSICVSPKTKFYSILASPTSKFYSVLMSSTTKFYSTWMFPTTAIVAQAWLVGYIHWAVVGVTEMEKILLSGTLKWSKILVSGTTKWSAISILKMNK